MTMDTAVNPTPNDSSAINFDTSTSTVSIYTTDNQSGIDMALGSPMPPMTYTVTVWLRTEAGTDKNAASEKLEFYINM